MSTESLQQALVALAAGTYLTSVFTRDGLLSFGYAMALFLFIFAPTYYVASIDTQMALDVFLYVPAASAVSAVLGSITSKVLDLGQLVDVWLTGSGGGPNSREELNFPFILLAFVALFFTAFFSVAAFQADNGDDFLNGLVTMSVDVARLFAIMSAVIAVAAIVVSAIQKKRGPRFRGFYDRATIVYLFVWVAALAAGLIPWYVATTPKSAGGWAGIIGSVVLLLGLAVGWAYERVENAPATNYNDKEQRKIWRRQYRLYMGQYSFSLVLTVLRVLVIVGLYCAIFVLGGYGRADVGTIGPQAIQDLFWSAYVAFWMAGAIFVFFLFYVAILFCYKFPRMNRDTESMVDGDGGSGGGVSTPLSGEDTDEGDGDGEGEGKGNGDGESMDVEPAYGVVPGEAEVEEYTVAPPPADGGGTEPSNARLRFTSARQARRRIVPPSSTKSKLDLSGIRFV